MAHSESKWLLNPMDRAAEILFGLFMALTFTCSIGVANKQSTEIRQLLFGAISCNLAWGLVDATMYLIGLLLHRNRNKYLLEQIRNSAETTVAYKHISDALPGVMASVIKADELEQLRKKLVSLPVSAVNPRWNGRDVKRAIALFFLMFISTFPVVIPFIFIRETQLALRVSNMVAIVMMFVCGWSLARYVGLNKWKLGFAMVLVGVILVTVTIMLGG